MVSTKLSELRVSRHGLPLPLISDRSRSVFDLIFTLCLPVRVGRNWAGTHAATSAGVALLFGVVAAFALAVLRAAEDLPVVLEEGLAPAVDAADVVDGEDAAALKEGVAPDGGAADAPAESET